MSRGVNKAIIVGHLGQNPEVKYTPSGQAVCNFSVATTEKWEKDGKTNEKTEWHRIVVWGKTAENCGKYLAKGRQVYLEGKLQTREWQDKEGNKKYTTEIVAHEVQFLGGGNAAAGSEGGQSSGGGQSQGGGGGGRAPTGGGTGAPVDDDVPFAFVPRLDVSAEEWIARRA